MYGLLFTLPLSVLVNFSHGLQSFFMSDNIKKVLIIELVLRIELE